MHPRHALHHGFLYKPASVKGYYVFWAGSTFFIEGVLYSSRGHADETSPVVLVDRYEYTLVFGPDVPRLATKILGAALARNALGGVRLSNEHVTHRSAFQFAPWPDGNDEPSDSAAAV